MMELRYLQQVANPYLDFMMKSKEKSNFNLKSPMLDIIVIQIEFFVQNLIETLNSNILYTVVDGTQLLSHGI